MKAVRVVRRIAFGLLLLAGVVAAVLFSADRLFDINIDMDLGFFRSSTHARSVAILQRTRSVFALSTVEIVYKTVFPYDFVPSDMDWRRFVEQHEEGRRMSAQETEYLRVYELCRDIGIDLRRDNDQFVVVTAVVHAGFDLSDTVYAEEEPDEERLRRVVEISENRVVAFRLPPVVVTDLIIEDARSGEYGYPDIDVGPEGWRRISAMVDTMVRERIVREGMLDAARANGREFLRKLILDLGYRDVIFFE